MVSRGDRDLTTSTSQPRYPMAAPSPAASALSPQFLSGVNELRSFVESAAAVAAATAGGTGATHAARRGGVHASAKQGLM